MRAITCLSLTTLVGVLVSACGGASEEAPAEKKIRVGAPLEAPVPEFLDDSGKRWIYVRRIDDYDDSPPNPKPGTRPDRDINLMSEAELTEYYRPRGDFGGHEYTLADEDARKFALELREITNHPTATGGDDDPNAVFDPGLDAERQRLQAERQQHEIINSDNRVNVNGNSPLVPDRWHGREVDRCSVFKMSNDFTAVTAAHCVHNGSTFKSRRSLKFSDPLGGRPVYPWECIGVVVPGCFDDEDTVSCDYAVFKLRDSGSSQWCRDQSSAYTVGHFGWNSIEDCATFGASLSGYPLPPPFGWSYPTLVYHHRNDAETTCWPYPFPDRVFYDNDTTGGQSGTAVVSFFGGQLWRARGIHHGGFSTGVDLTNQGRRMTQGLRNWLVSNGGS